MNPKVDTYLVEGCMRCKFGGTPQCKVNTWREELILLRKIVLACGLTEEVKWGVPCYSFDRKNVLIISAFKEYASLNFFKGVLLDDPYKILEKPGENSQSSRLVKFTHTRDIIAAEETIKAYIFQAIEVEKKGLKVEFKENPEPIPEELSEKFEEYPNLKQAFFSLTPGRQRGYIIYFSQPKQRQSRERRIEKYMEKILKGEGIQEQRPE